jgi:hypothetical protein
MSSFISTSRGIPQPVVAVAHVSLPGVRVEMFGGQLFGQVLVFPRAKGLGFVLTATEFPIEVWNAFRDTGEMLDAITISGSGGLTIADPVGEPRLFAPLQSVIYQATVPSAGATEIDQDVDFGFAGSPPGTDSEVTGSRIVLWSAAPEWGEGMEESIEFFTDVLKKYSDMEQRRRIRSIPRRALRFPSLTLNARDAAGMESLVWGWQHQPFGVPWWPDAQPLLGDVEAGTLVIPVQTADRLFAAGGLLALWSSEFIFEALNIESVAADSVTVASPTQFSWTAGPATRVLPVLLCRIPGSVEIDRHSSSIDQLELAFIGESGQIAPAPSCSPTQFLGFDVLEIAPNWNALPLKRRYVRSLATIDPKVGPIEVIDKGGTAIVGTDLPWWLDSHSAVTAFRAFVLRRFGQWQPFWLPTWDQDLVLAQDVAATDTGIIIQSEFYTRFLFPNASRQFLAFIPFDGSGNVYVKVATATDNGDGTESLGFGAAIGKAFSAGTTLVSFLTFARLASDRVAIKWDHSEHAEAALSIVEVPREVPS